MLAFQTMNTKRRRDDDSDSEDDRYLKRSRPWTLQTALPWAEKHNAQTANAFSTYVSNPSPPRMIPGLEVMAPFESEYSDAYSPASIQEESQVPMSPRCDVDYAMQVDDDDEPDILSSQPPDSPFVANFRPAKLNLDLFSHREQTKSAPDISHRMPTPIYSTFQNAGGMNGLGYPNSGFAGGLSMSNGFLGVPSGSSNGQTSQLSHRRQRSQDRTVRMPSPISEDEDMPDTPTAQTQSQLSRLSVTTNHTSDRMDPEMPPPLATPKGRKRSGALTSMGRFSMGYRDDCEKCRMRVPGHYSHFL